MAEPEIPQESHDVSESWQQMVQAVLAFVVLLGTAAMFHYYAPMVTLGVPPSDLQQQVHELTAQVDLLAEQQAMPAVVLNRYRNSIGYIYGVYQVGFANQRPAIRARVSGTGFLVGDRLIATNPLGETILGSTAISGGMIFLRSDKHLFCIGAPK